VQRPQPAEVHVALRPFEIELRKRKLERDPGACQKADQRPETGGDHAGADHTVHVFTRQVHLRRDRLVGVAQNPQEKPAGDNRHCQRIDQIGQIARVIGRDQRAKRDHTKHDQLDIVRHIASLRLLSHAPP